MAALFDLEGCKPAAGAHDRLGSTVAVHIKVLNPALFARTKAAPQALGNLVCPWRSVKTGETGLTDQGYTSGDPPLRR